MTAWRYGWTEIRNKYIELKESEKREQVIKRKTEREFDYNDYIDEQFPKNQVNSNLYDNATKLAFIGIGVIPLPDNMELPKAFHDVEFCKFIITNAPKAKKIYHDMILRELEQPEKIKTEEKNNHATNETLLDYIDDEKPLEILSEFIHDNNL